MKKRIVVAMSGGVDSSVAAALLLEQGYECIGMHFKIPVESGGAGAALQKKCCTLEAAERARRVCRKLGIPFYVMNVSAKFKKCVIDYFLDSYARGETPNPCVECNRNIKFGELLKRAGELKARYLATGHYARVLFNKSAGKFELLAAADKEKDQTYFLYHLSQEKLKRVVFPLGAFLKSDVYRLARGFGFYDLIDKQQSQGVCFFSETTPRQFLMRNMPRRFLAPGPIVTLGGREIGMHEGLPLYTIGQRQGLKIGGVRGEPEGQAWYVVWFDRKRNRLIVGRERDLYRDSFVCRHLRFVSGKALARAAKVKVKIRHRGELVPAEFSIKKGKGFVKCAKKLRAISPGQTAVFYKHDKVLGGGVIEA